jgi:hypothetical protein
MTDDDGRATKGISTYCPVLDEGELPWYRVWTLRRLMSRPGVINMLYRYGRLVLIVRPEEQPSVWQIVKSRFTSLAVVDVRPYDLTLQGQLPCRGGAHHFGITVRLTCRVSNPEELRTANIRDIGARLHRTIFEHIDRVRHKHGVDDVARVHTTITSVLEKLSVELPDLEPAFEVTKVSLEVSIDEDARSILRTELTREYCESIVRMGATGIAAFYLARNPKDPQTAIKILQDNRRALVQLRRDEEEYLLRNEIVRPQQLEGSALERLSRLELPANGESIDTVSPLRTIPEDTPVADMSAIDVDYDFDTNESTDGQVG